MYNKKNIFLAQSSQNPQHFLSVESDQGVFHYVNEVTGEGWLPMDPTL